MDTTDTDVEQPFDLEETLGGIIFLLNTLIHETHRLYELQATVAMLNPQHAKQLQSLLDEHQQLEYALPVSWSNFPDAPVAE